MKKTTFLLMIIVLICSCQKDGSENSNNANTVVTTEAHYKHEKDILSFCINNSNLAIVDNEGLTIIENNDKSFFDVANYSVGNLTFSAKLNNVNDMIYSGGSLYIGTSDGHLVKYNNGNFEGFPIRIHAMKQFMQNEDIQAIWEWYNNDFPINLPSGKVRTEIELDGEELSIQDEWPCLDFLNLSENHCDDYDLFDFASLERFAMLGQNGALLSIPDYDNNGIFEYTPDFSQLPFSRFNHIEFFNHASSIGDAPDKYYFDHIWVATDAGLAYYLMEENVDIIFNADDWKHLNTSNSNLNSNLIEDLQYISNNRLISFSNNPSSLNYINAEDGSVCVFDAPSTGSIAEISVDGSNLFVAQGGELFMVKRSDLNSACGF